MISLRKSFAGLAFACTFYVLPSAAQIQIDDLRPADAYDAGLLTEGQGGLDAMLWQGTSTERAAKLIDAIGPIKTGPGLDLVRTVVLSGGVPPAAQDNMGREHYIRARLGSLLKLGDLQAFDAISERANLDKIKLSYVKIFANRALLGGQSQEACQIADSITVERKAPYWAKLRAYCHFVRGELPAAELTVDILQRAKHKDESFFALLSHLIAPAKTNFANTIVKTPLDTAMARAIYQNKHINYKALPHVLAKDIALDIEADGEARMWALKRAGHLMSAEQTGQVLNGLSEASLEDLKTLSSKTWAPEVWGQAYKSLKTSTDIRQNADIIAAMLTRANAAGMFTPISQALASDIAILPHNFQAGSEAPLLFARIAAKNRDLGALRSLHLEMQTDNPLRNRIALASDAIGHGFMLGNLGTDIDARLGLKDSEKSRAVRDTYIAAALGANLSDQSMQILVNTKSLNGTPAHPGQLLVLQDASRRRAKAETVLQAAKILGSKPLSSVRADSLASVLMALSEVGATDMAAQLAAQDFLTP